MTEMRDQIAAILVKALDKGMSTDSAKEGK